MSAVFGDMCCKYCRWSPIVVFTSNNTQQNAVREYLVHFVNNCNVSYLYSTLFVCVLAFVIVSIMYLIQMSYKPEIHNYLVFIIGLDIWLENRDTYIAHLNHDIIISFILIRSVKTCQCNEDEAKCLGKYDWRKLQEK